MDASRCELCVGSGRCRRGDPPRGAAAAGRRWMEAPRLSRAHAAVRSAHDQYAAKQVTESARAHSYFLS